VTKNELAERVALRTGLSPARARQLVEAALEVVSDELAAGGEVALAGFGKFSVSHRAARQGRNPSTGQPISFAASKAAKFSAASAVKGRLNNGEASSAPRGRSRPTRSVAAAPKMTRPPAAKGGRPRSGGGAKGPKQPHPLRPGGDPPSRYLIAQGPEAVSINKVFSVLVRVVLRGTGAKLHPFSVPPAGVRILLVAHAPNLRVVSEGRQTLHVPYDHDSDPVMFEFQARSSGLNNVAISAWNGGVYLGELAFDVLAEPQASVRPDRELRGDMSLASDDGAVSLVVRFDPRQRAYRFEFRDIDNPSEVPGQLTYDPKDALVRLIGNLNTLAGDRSNLKRAQARAFLVNAGATLWQEVIPPVLREQFWARRSRITQLTIFTENDPLPWELLYPKDRGHDSGFLLRQFPVMRGIFDRFPSRRLRFAPARFVLPASAPTAAAGEIDALRELLGVKRTRATIVSSLTDLTTLIDRGRFGLLHFACHQGLTDVGSEPRIILDERPFTPVLMRTARIERTLEHARPLVFINACGTAVTTPRYNRLDGWAAAFLEAGAAAFAGSLWDVRDTSARAFAEVLYGELSTGTSLGVALLRARRVAASSRGDPTWLAYSVYGDAHATVSQIN
jgi:nucleoid DNA-binding protein